MDCPILYRSMIKHFKRVAFSLPFVITCGTLVVPKVKAYWSSLRNSLAQRESPDTQPASRGVLERLFEL